MLLFVTDSESVFVLGRRGIAVPRASYCSYVISTSCSFVWYVCMIMCRYSMYEYVCPLDEWVGR